MKKIRLTEDVRVEEYITLQAGTELEVIHESERFYTVKILTENKSISKFQCELVSA